MKRLVLSFACSACAVCMLAGADWLGSGGDAQHSGWQQHGKSIGVANAGDLKLLWKLALDNRSHGMNSLTAPTMLGPIVTHRGVKELVFIGGASDNLYAVDADRGRLFWRRHVDTGTSCGEGLTATPVLAPPAPGTKVRDDDDEGATPMRPFYFVASDGVLHTIRPADGMDMAPERKFVPAGANLSALALFGKFVYAGTSAGCGVPEGVWGIDIGAPDATAKFTAGKSSGVSVGADGDVYSDLGSFRKTTLEAKQAFPIRAAVPPISFSWKSRELVAVAGAGELALVENGKVLSRAKIEAARGMASWTDGFVRWIYVATGEQVEAYRLQDAGTLERRWVSGVLTSPLAPVIGNGVLYVLDGGGKSAHAVLYALDARTGKQLYTSGDAVNGFVSSSGLALANGHICFGTWDNVLYCFGFPIEI